MMTTPHTDAEPGLDADPPAASAPDFWSSIEVLRRHARLFWGIVVATIVLAGAAFVLIGPTYEATASMLLLVPTAAAPDASAPDAGAASGGGAATAAGAGSETTPVPTTVPARANPYLGFGAALNVTGSILAKWAMTDVATTAMVGDGATATYVVDPPSADLPTVTVRATARSADDAVRTAQRVRDGLTAELEREQQASGAPRSTWITLSILQPGDRAVTLQTSRVRAVVTIVVLGLALAVGAAFFAESLAQHRRTRRRASGAVPAEPAVADHGPGDASRWAAVVDDDQPPAPDDLDEPEELSTPAPRRVAATAAAVSPRATTLTAPGRRGNSDRGGSAPASAAGWTASPATRPSRARGVIDLRGLHPTDEDDEHVDLFADDVLLEDWDGTHGAAGA